jgi:hypothetical protein
VQSNKRSWLFENGSDSTKIQLSLTEKITQRRKERY